MQLNGTRLLHAPRDQVWLLLSDPPALSDFIPGCEALTVQTDGAYLAVIAARVGPVSARFTGTLALDEVHAPHRYRLRFQGQGGAAGFARGEALVELADQGATTLLDYRVQAHVGGKLAQVGSRLIDVTAGRLADEFFDRMAARFVQPGLPTVVEDEVGGVAAPPPEGPTRRPLLLLSAGVVLAAAVWWLASRSG